MLREARREAARAGVSIPFHEGPFVDLPHMVPNRFDAVIALGNGLCNQERREEIVASLRAMHGRCAPGGICLVGIKDFDAIRRERPRFHGHCTERRGDERRIFFEVWEFQDPILVCRACSLHGRGDDWCAHCAETREYMLGAGDVQEAARQAGFTVACRLDHPSEAVYLLR
jgi:SAM-dependent methyltransferase